MWKNKQGLQKTLILLGIMLLLTSCGQVVQELAEEMGSSSWAMSQKLGVNEVGAKITPKEALFLFSIGWRIARSEQWQWCLPETPDNQREYSWEVTVQNGQETYEFGFSLYKFPNCPQQSGRTLDLIQRGQASVWKRSTTGGAEMLPIGDLIDGRIVISEVDGRILIALYGGELIEWLFSQRPTTASLELITPGEPRKTMSFSLNYSEK